MSFNSGHKNPPHAFHSRFPPCPVLAEMLKYVI